MKKLINVPKVRCIGIIAIVAVIAFSMASCGDSGDPTSPGHTHAWGEWTFKTAATCITPEVQERTCSCGEKETQTVGSTLGHSPGEWQEKTAATEKLNGRDHKLCINCNQELETKVGAYATGTTGLAFTLIEDDSEFEVAVGTATSGEVHIPAFRLHNGVYLPITTIPNYGFLDNEGPGFDISAITFAEECELTNIGEYAFSGLIITSIILPDSVTSIGRGAFNGCPNLVSIILSNSLQFIEWAMFTDCTNLESIIIPDSVIGIGNSAFENCTNLANVTFQAPISSAYFGIDAFKYLGDIRNKFYEFNASNGTPGNYTTTAPVGSGSIWTKQP